MQQVTLTCTAIPVAQPRQRHAVIAGHVRNYTPTAHPVNVFKAALQMEAGKVIGQPLQGPLILKIRFYLPRPQRLMTKKAPEGPLPHVGKPDLDNLAKSAMDALKGIAWADDSQVYASEASKCYCEKSGQPRVQIVISEDATGLGASA